MAEQRLIDANKLKKKSVPYIRGRYGYSAKSEDWAVLVKDINNAPTIDPEELPIVKELRDELKKTKAERDKNAEYLDIVAQNIADLTGAVIKMEQERDEAVAQLRGYCPACKNYTANSVDEICISCKYGHSLFPYNAANDNWEWIGIMEEIPRSSKYEKLNEQLLLTQQKLQEATDSINGICKTYERVFHD